MNLRFEPLAYQSGGGSNAAVWIVAFLAIAPMALGGGPTHIDYGTDIDTFLTLYGPGNQTQEVASNDDLLSTFAGISVTLEANHVYYVKATVFDNPGRNDTGPYRIRVSGPGDGGAPPSSPEATPLPVNGGALAARINSESQADWYVFKTGEAGMYLIATLGAYPARPVRWPEPHVTYNLDQGPLGDVGAVEAAELAKNGVEIWNQVTTTSFRFQEGERLDDDYGAFSLGPSPLYSHRLFYHPGQEKTYLFGGYDANSTYDDLWWWDDTQWRKESSVNAPTARNDFGIASDTTLKEVLFFGGFGEQAPLNDTWVWDAAGLRQLFPGTSPSSRHSFSMTYDSARQEIVLFGGAFFREEYYADTWVWNDGTWAQRQSAHAPSARAGHALFFDPVRNKVMLFGGHTNEETFNDLWEWDGQDWTPVETTDGPAARESAAVAVDTSSNQTLLFGGYSESGAVLNDTWMWDGAQWTRLFPNRPPSRRQLHSMTYDEQLGHTLLFGGERSGAALSDTWAWGDGGWSLTAQSKSFGDILNEQTRQGNHPLFFDNDGELVKLLNGEEAEFEILGFSSTQYQYSTYVNGYMVINGQFLTSESGLPLEYGKQMVSHVIAHEIGHFAGLRHSQLYSYAFHSSYGIDDTYLPVMYPIVANLADRPELRPRHDDGVWLSELYPAEDGSYTNDYGIISGRAVFGDGLPVLGGIVSARLADDPLNIAVSNETDSLGEIDGTFHLPGLPPGEYEVWIEPIASTDFNGGSSVGEHSRRTTGQAFERPPRPEYYNGNGEAGDSSEDGPSLLQRVSVRAGETSELQFICEELDDSTEQFSQLLAFGSPMVSGHGPNGEDPFPFTVIVHDALEDMSLTVTPHSNQPLGVSVLLNGSTFYTTYGAPRPNRNAMLVYLAALGRMMLFGGWLAEGPSSESWDWNGASWSLVPAFPTPNGRISHGLVYDRDGQRAILFGGDDPVAGTKLGDTWLYEDGRWSEAITAESPPARSSFSMAYDNSRSVTVLYGGSASNSQALNDTWEFDGEEWRKMSEGSPIARFGHGMAYDAVREQVILFGGQNVEGAYYDGTWGWTGASWEWIDAESGPSARKFFGMTTDSLRERIVLFGGANANHHLNDTWIWDGTTWTEIQPTRRPSPRSRAGMAYDAARDRVVLFGGLNDSGRLAETWEFTGEDWSDRTPVLRVDSGPYAMTFTRDGADGPPLQSGTYVIEMERPTSQGGGYTIQADSASAPDLETGLSSWELY